MVTVRRTTEVQTADRAAKGCSILPSTDEAELESALVLGRTAVEIGNGGDWNLLALGMAEYRSGNYAADENNPLAGNVDFNDLVVWLAYKEAKALIKFDAVPKPKAKAKTQRG